MKFRRILTLILGIAILSSLLSGCGSDKPTEISTPPTPDSSTPPVTVQPSLPDTLQHICDLGIADKEILSHANEVCSRKEATEMLANVHKLQYGEDSQYLADPNVVEGTEAATRYFFAQALYFSAMETVYDIPYENYDAWATYCTENERQDIWPDSQVIAPDADGVVRECSVWEVCPDLNEIEQPDDETGLRYWIDFGSSPAVNYAMLTYDRTDGRKVLEIDENFNFRPFEPMTVEQVAEAALRYYNSFESAAQMISYEDTAAFDSSIITSEMLAKKTALPDASCAMLPGEWHGVLMFDMGRVTNQALDGASDKQICEYEIQSVKDAGFNFIGLAFDFSVLQGPVPETGKLNETRLKELDQVIAYCIERDIHVDLRCAGLGGFTKDDAFSDWQQWNHDGIYNTEYAGEFAALWKALAQRYAEIPNCYLSFNLMIEPEINSDDQYAAFFGPAVSAIREASPDRCIIADIHSGGLTGRSMAELGVALSYHAYDPREFCVLTTENQNDAAYLNSVAWPFVASDGKTYDAEAVLNSQIPGSVSANELANIAKEYNVGFMIGEFGVFGTGITSNRYKDETLYAYFKDMTDTMDEKGYGWCCGVWYGSLGVVIDYPSVNSTTYQQVEDYAFYIDQTMMEWFQEFNG